MKLILIAFIALLSCTVTCAQSQPLPDSLKVTLTMGEIRQIIQAAEPHIDSKAITKQWYALIDQILETAINRKKKKP